MSLFLDLGQRDMRQYARWLLGNVFSFKKWASPFALGMWLGCPAIVDRQ